MTRISGAVAAANGSQIIPSPPPPPGPGDRLMIPTSGVWFGAFPCDSSGACNAGTLATLETEAARSLQVIRVYASSGIWGQWFTSGSLERLFFEAGYLLAFSAKYGRYSGTTKTAGYSWAQVAAGNADAALIARANELAAIDQPVWISFHHESDTGDVNGSNHPTYGLASDFAAAWRRAYGIFQPRCPKAIFTLNYGGYKTHTSWWANSYPGDAYVDWLASDPYALSGDGSNPISTQQSSSTFRNWATVTKPGRHDFPWAIWETGCYDDAGLTGVKKKAWFETNRAWFATYDPLKQYLYWNSGSLRANTSTHALEGWQDMAADTHMTAVI